MSILVSFNFRYIAGTLPNKLRYLRQNYNLVQAGLNWRHLSSKSMVATRISIALTTGVSMAAPTGVSIAIEVREVAYDFRVQNYITSSRTSLKPQNLTYV